MSALDDLFIEIEKHAVMRGHASLLLKVREEHNKMLSDLMKYEVRHEVGIRDKDILQDEILNLKAQNTFLQNTLAFHPRARKLMNKRKNFVVIARDEPYFKQAYDLIRSHEQEKGTWTDEDEQAYQLAVSETER